MDRRTAIELAKSTGKVAVEFNIVGVAHGYTVVSPSNLVIGGIVVIMGLNCAITSIVRKRDYAEIDLELTK